MVHLSHLLLHCLACSLACLFDHAALHSLFQLLIFCSFLAEAEFEDVPSTEHPHRAARLNHRFPGPIQQHQQ